MKALALVLLLVVAINFASAMTKEKHSKKAYSDSQKKHIAEIEEKLEQLLELEAELESEIAEAEEETSDEENEVVEEDREDPVEEEEEHFEEENLEEELPEEAVEEENPEEPNEELLQIQGNACLDMYCGAGRMCVVNDAGEGECRCVNVCGQETDVRRRVCSNHNETWMSDCELYRQRCLCQEGDESCLSPDYSHAHIDYYGQCQDLPECSPGELEDFPRRMSEWLFNIMREMAEREILSEHYVRLEREAEENPSKQWTYAVVWKWCELDSHPKDSAVSRHELFPIRAPLVTLEHCISTFLDSCDENDDHLITLKEWGKCSNLSEEELDKLEDMCEDIRDD
ncbi:SPARC [Panulirus ornatus]|uniref:SPARC n=1 Tax=Panulirus ornatus TaxID=150431 RepID=UPI003A8BBDC7